jgi:RNA polymerase sigma-70 factor (ECF subfamily)
MAEGADALDADLIRRVVLDDDQRAFSQLLRRHQSAVRLFLRRLIGNDWSRADDLAQETFLKAYRNIGGFQSRGRFLSWLLKIAYQLFITEQRSAALRHVHIAVDDQLLATESTEDAVAKRTFDQLLASLGAEERAAIVLHYRHEMTHPEIAATLDLPLGTVKTLIRRARIKLQERHQASNQKVQG